MSYIFINEQKAKAFKLERNKLFFCITVIRVVAIEESDKKNKNKNYCDSVHTIIIILLLSS